MPRRCAYRDGRGRACGRPAAGNPPLCVTHRAELEDEATGIVDHPVVEAVMGRVMEHPRVGGILDSFGGLVDRFTGFIDKATSGDPAQEAEAAAQAQAAAAGFQNWNARRKAHAPPPNSQQRRQPPPHQPPPPAPTKDDPRVVLGFDPKLKLTKVIVKERQRDLAKLYHPDRGGSQEAMKRVNAAVDELLKSL